MSERIRIISNTLAELVRLITCVAKKNLNLPLGNDFGDSESALTTFHLSL